MTFLITGDLHLTDRPRDEYRFGLFPWLAKHQERYETRATFILGDLTDAKDKHSSRLVNRLVEGLIELRPPVYIDMGNHDYLAEDSPFFQFLNCIEGLHFVSVPTMLMGLKVALIPHYRDQAEFDQACGSIPAQIEHIMLHQTIEGAIAETGSRLSGLRASVIESLKPLGVWSGDVHKPQQVGPVTYVGAPYHVRFGDNYTPRVLLIKKGATDLHFPAPQKLSLRIREDCDIFSQGAMSGDQLKLTLELAREEATEWQSHKARILNFCKASGFEVHGLDVKILGRKRERIRIGKVQGQRPDEVLNSFCNAEGVASNIRDKGVSLLV